MSVVYQEITDPLLIPECITIQKKVFDLIDVDIYPESYFSMLIRKEHPLGMLVGCFQIQKDKKTLIGLAVLQNDRLPNTAYCLFIAILPKFQNKMYGFVLAKKVKELAIQKGYKKMYGIYNPLEANLGKLYAHLGVTASNYIEDSYTTKNNIDTLVDKVLFEWKLNPIEASEIKKPKNKLSYNDILNKYPIASDTLQNEEKLLIEIPNNFIELKNTDFEKAIKWRSVTKYLLSEYLNTKQYKITNCVSGRINNEKKTYYLLSK